MAEEGMEKLLEVYKNARVLLRNAKEGLELLETTSSSMASSMASQTQDTDTTEVVRKYIAESLTLCSYMKCHFPESEHTEWKDKVELIEQGAAMLLKNLETYTSKKKQKQGLTLQIQEGIDLLVGAVHSTKSQKEQVRKKYHSLSGAPSKSSHEKKRRKREQGPSISCGGQVHLFSKTITKNMWHNHQLELGKAFCKDLWGESVPKLVHLMGDEDKIYEVSVLGTRLSKGFSEFINSQNVKPGDAICLDPLGDNQIKFCIHTGLDSTSDIWQSQGGSIALSPPRGALVAAAQVEEEGPLAIDLGPRAGRKFEEHLADFVRSELARGLPEEVMNEYVAICKRSVCLPHESKIATCNVSEGIVLMVNVYRQMKTVDIRKEGLTSLKCDLKLLEIHGFDCIYLKIICEKMSSLEENLKEYEEEQDKLRDRITKLQEKCKELDLLCRKYQYSI